MTFSTTEMWTEQDISDVTAQLFQGHKPLRPSVTNRQKEDSESNSPAVNLHCHHKTEQQEK